MGCFFSSFHDLFCDLVKRLTEINAEIVLEVAHESGIQTQCRDRVQQQPEVKRIIVWLLVY
jgi:hypothetical protein